MLNIECSNYQILIEQLLTDMNENIHTIKDITHKLNYNRSKALYKVTQIINKILYSTGKLNTKCTICKSACSTISILKYKELTTEQLLRLIKNIELYLENTQDYTININIYYIAIIFMFAMIFPIYIAIYNMYLVQLINYAILMYCVYPLIYTIYKCRNCIEHDRPFSDYTYIDIFWLYTYSLSKNSAINKTVWSCKYANILSHYIIRQIVLIKD